MLGDKFVQVLLKTSNENPEPVIKLNAAHTTLGKKYAAAFRICRFGRRD